MKYKWMFVVLAIVLALSFVVVGCGEEEKATLKISDLNWGSAHFQSEIAKIMIEEGYGYPVELVPGSTIPLFQGLRTGDIDIFIEGWLQNQQEAFDQAIEAGDIELLGILNDDNWQSTFVVPTYVIEGDAERSIDPMAPGLKSVYDLPDYTDVFSNPENPGKGLIVNGPAGWECEIVLPQQVTAYGLDDYYDVINAGSQEGLFASLKGAYEKGDPWLGYLWGPTWIAGALELTLLEEPEYDPAVWGDNYGCAWPSVDLFIASHIDLRDTAPDVAEMFENWVMETATLNEALSYSYATGAEYRDVAIWFLQNREDVWTEFVSSDVADKIKDAVADM